MVKPSILQAALLLATSTPSVAVNLASAKGTLNTLIAPISLPEEPGKPAIMPEYHPVPQGFQLDEAALANFTRRSQFPAGLEPRDILGPDNRYQWDSTDYPFTPMGKLTFNAGNGGFLCSGTMIGPRHVLTAQHCARGDNWRNGRFAPSFLNGERLGAANVVSVIYDPDFDSYPKGGQCFLKNDYAILILDQRIGEKTGYMFLAGNADPGLVGQPVLNTCGYPGDKGGNSKWCQYGGKINKIGGCGDNSGPITTDLDAIGGQSGSPVWYLREDKTLWIWGVLSSVNNVETFLAAGNTMLTGWQFALNLYP